MSSTHIYMSQHPWTIIYVNCPINLINSCSNWHTIIHLHFLVAINWFCTFLMFFFLSIDLTRNLNSAAQNWIFVYFVHHFDKINQMSQYLLQMLNSIVLISTIDRVLNKWLAFWLDQPLAACKLIVAFKNDYAAWPTHNHIFIYNLVLLF